MTLREGEAAAYAASLPPAPESGLSPRRRQLVFLIVCIGSIMSSLDVFIVNVAIPSLRLDLHAGPAEVELVVTAYSMTYAVLLITGGRLGDLFGRVRVYLIGLAVFTAASAACGAVPSPELLIGFRVVQAAGAAVMVPQAYAVIQRVFPPAERIKGLAILSSAASVGVVFAQVVGGALIQANPFNLGWRVVFFVNVPFGIATFVAGILYLPTQRPERSQRLDIPGALLATACLLLLVVPVVEGRDLGWPPWLFACLGLAPVVFGGFLLYQRRRAAAHRSPLIELSLFTRRSFAAGMPMVLLGQVSNAGMYFVLTLYLQDGRGLSPGFAGLLFAPNGLAYMVLAPFAPRLARRFGRRTMVAGYLLMAASISSIVVLLHFYGTDGSPYVLMPSIGLIGAGQSMVNAPLYGTVLYETPPGHEGSASGILATTQQSGSAIGVAISGLLFFTALGASATLTGHIPAAAASAAYGRALFLNIGLMSLMALSVYRLPRMHLRTVKGSEEPASA